MNKPSKFIKDTASNIVKHLAALPPEANEAERETLVADIMFETLFPVIGEFVPENENPLSENPF